MVWRLGLCAFTARDPGSVSGLGTNIPQAVHIAKKTKQNKTKQNKTQLLGHAILQFYHLKL